MEAKSMCYRQVHLISFLNGDRNKTEGRPVIRNVLWPVTRNTNACYVQTGGHITSCQDSRQPSWYRLDGVSADHRGPSQLYP